MSGRHITLLRRVARASQRELRHGDTLGPGQPAAVGSRRADLEDRARRTRANLSAATARRGLGGRPARQR